MAFLETGSTPFLRAMLTTAIAWRVTARCRRIWSLRYCVVAPTRPGYVSSCVDGGVGFALAMGGGTNGTKAYLRSCA